MESSTEIDFTLLVVLGTLGVLVLIFFIFLFVLLYQKKMLANKKDRVDTEKAHQKELLDNSLAIAEHERQKIATDLHDEIGIILNVLKINLDRIKKNLNKEEVVNKLLADSSTQLNTTIEIVREIHRNIMPSTLMKSGFVKGMVELCNQITNASGATVNLISEVETLNIEKLRELQLYRLLKEVLNNTLKHAKPDHVEINMSIMQDKLNVLILHNGSGITTEEIKSLAKVSKGLGLKSILTRSELLNAKIIFSIPSAEMAEVKIEMDLT